MYLTKQERLIIGFLAGTLIVNVILHLVDLPPNRLSRQVDQTTQPDSIFLAKVRLVDSLVLSQTSGENIRDTQIRAMSDQRQQFKISINTAQAEELQMLPSIGPVMAKRIIAHREKNGYFTALQDLEQVRGIGPATAANIEPHITFKTEIP